MDEQETELHQMAEEWACLRHKTENERDPLVLVRITERLDAILNRVEQLCLGDDGIKIEQDSSRRPTSAGRQRTTWYLEAWVDDSSKEKSGDGD